jgi:hypothetical protein
MLRVHVDGAANAELAVGLDAIVAEGARRMLAAALEAEVDAYVSSFTGELDEYGRRLVVRNGHAEARPLVTGAGPLEVQAPRVNDRRVDEVTGERMRFASSILPPWARKSPKVAEVLPHMYLHGMSSGDFAPALAEFFGSAAGLSASVITRLTTDWLRERDQFARRSLKDTDFVYVWVDGIHLKTTNPIESTFATVRLRTKVTKGPGSRPPARSARHRSRRHRWRRERRGPPPGVAHLLAGRPFDGIGGPVIGPARRLDCRPAPQSVGVLLFWRVQRSVGGVEVLLTSPAIGQSLDLHLAEDRRQGAPVPCFDAGVRVAGRIDHLGALLALRPHDEMVLEELAEHLSALLVEMCFERSMLECHGLWCAQERDDTFELLTRRSEGGGVRPPYAPAHRPWPNLRACTRATRSSRSPLASFSRSPTACL